MQRIACVMLLLVAPIFGAGKDLAGKYAGEWKSNGAAGGGTLTLTLNAQSGGIWKCEFSFQFQGEDVKTTTRTCSVEGSSLEASYDFEMEGNVLRSKISGQWDGKAFAGQYATTTADGADAIDDGSWNAAPAAGQ